MLYTLFLVVTITVLCASFALVDASSELKDNLVRKYNDNTEERLTQRGVCNDTNLNIRRKW
jgi:hypothetical protein